VRRLEEKKDTGSKQGGELAGWLALAVQFRHRSLSCAACALQLFSVMAMFMQKVGLVTVVGVVGLFCV
jgi:hypothetical protein